MYIYVQTEVGTKKNVNSNEARRETRKLCSKRLRMRTKLEEIYSYYIRRNPPSIGFVVFFIPHSRIRFTALHKRLNQMVVPAARNGLFVSRISFILFFFVRLIFFITQFVVIHPPNVVLFAPFRQSTHSTLGAIGWLPTSPLLSNLIHFSIFSFDTFELPRSDSLLGDTIGLNECRKRNEKILKQKNGRRKRSEKMCSTKCIECNATEQYFRVSSATGETI